MVFAATIASASSPCGADGRPWILVRFAPDTWNGSRQRAMLDQLAVGKAEEGTLVCFEGGPEAPVTEVVVDPSDPSQTDIDIFDYTTKKRVIRKTDLTAVPEDSRPLALAIAVDDLLNATWAELKLRGGAGKRPEEPEEPPSPPEGKPAPPAPRAPAQQQSPPRRVDTDPTWFAAVGAEITGDIGDATSAGAHAFFQAWPVAELGLRLAAHGSQSFALDSPLGELGHQAFGGRFRITYAPLRLASVKVGPMAEAAVDVVAFEPSAAGGADASRGSGVAVLVGGGLEAHWLVAAPLAATISTGARPVVRRVEATADGEPIGGVRSVQLFGELSVGAAW